MTNAEELIIACLGSKDSKTLSAINRDWLDGKEKRMYEDVMNYYRTEGELMGMKSFCEKYSLDSAKVDSKPTYYLNQLRERFIVAQITDKVPRILTGVKSDPREKLSELQDLTSALSSETIDNTDTLYSDDTDKRLDSYKERTKTSGVTYLSMGTEDLDKIFYGYSQTDVITIGGKAGQGKTWLIAYLVRLLDNVVRDKEKKSGEHINDILFITNEMSSDEIKERLDCIRFQLPYAKFLSGTLNEVELKNYRRGLVRLKRHPSHIRFIENCITIDELTTKIGLYQPCAVFIDGSYLMEPKQQEGWEKITYITRNLKRLAKTFKCPIINTTQLKRRTGTKSSSGLSGQDDFAYSSSYVQDSDIAIRMYQDADMKFHDVIGCEVAKGRRVASGTTIVFENNLDKMIQSLTLPDDTSAEVPKTEEL